MGVEGRGRGRGRVHQPANDGRVGDVGDLDLVQAEHARTRGQGGRLLGEGGGGPHGLAKPPPRLQSIAAAAVEPGEVTVPAVACVGVGVAEAPALE